MTTRVRIVRTTGYVTPPHGMVPGALATVEAPAEHGAVYIRIDGMPGLWFFYLSDLEEVTCDSN